MIAWGGGSIKAQVKASEMPNDAKHHASVLACKDAQLGDSNVLTTGASERVGCGQDY